MPDPFFTEAQVRALAPEKAVRRANAFCLAGAVSELAWRCEVLRGKVRVRGAEHEVRVWLRGNRLFTFCDCSDFDEWGVWCTHTVAVLLVHARGSVPVFVEPTIRELMAPLDRTELECILELLAERHPAAYEFLRDEAARQRVRLPDSFPGLGTLGADRAQRPSPRAAS